jgi:hypothetical protein
MLRQEPFFATPTKPEWIRAIAVPGALNDANFCNCLFAMRKFRADHILICCAAMILPGFCAG